MYVYNSSGANLLGNSHLELDSEDATGRNCEVHAGTRRCLVALEITFSIRNIHEVMIVDYLHINLDKELMLNDNLSKLGPGCNFGSKLFGKNSS